MCPLTDSRCLYTIDKSHHFATIRPYMPKEEEQFRGPGSEESSYTSELPSDLAAFLRTKDVACLMHETNQGTVFVVKLPNSEISTLSGRVPLSIRHELYQHPAAPVIRTVVRIYDRPESPLGLETFTNVEQEDQRADFARLARQEQLLLLFYDEGLTHRLTKATGNVDPETIRHILETADAVRAAIPDDRYDFDRAKADVIARTTL